MYGTVLLFALYLLFEKSRDYCRCLCILFTERSSDFRKLKFEDRLFCRNPCGPRTCLRIALWRQGKPSLSPP
jgi:hypothetical protein